MPKLSFFEVVEAEAKVINRRRELVASGQLAKNRGHGGDQEAVARKYAHHGAPVKVTDSGQYDERGEVVPLIASERPIVGLALSGGGIRSAAFCLGALQGLDAVNADTEPQMLDAVDYLSTVSGGGYVGTSLAAGLMQTQGQFPFASKLDQQETIQTQHLRDYSNYLAPKGLLDVFVGLVVVLRGIMLNAMIFFGIILACAALTVWIHPDESWLDKPFLDFTAGRFRGVFLWTITFTALFVLIQIAYAILFLRPPGPGKPRITLVLRETCGRAFVYFLGLCALLGFLELQAYVLAGLFDASHLASNDPDFTLRNANLLGQTLHRVDGHAANLWTTLIAGATGLATFGSKLTAVVAARQGDNSWMGTLKYWASKITVYVAAAVVPLLFWVTYLTLCFWGIRWVDGNHVVSISSPQMPDFFIWLSVRPAPWSNFAFVFALTAALLLGLSILVTPNANSLHGYYRDRLSRAFLWKLDDLQLAARRKAVKDCMGLTHGDSLDVDQFKLSSLKPYDTASGFYQAVECAPFLMINAAVNLEGSNYLNRRGRNADSFIFSPLAIGSEATGYASTRAMESADRNLNMGTAMAISGAAASANMGASTVRALTFSLTALNVRLGYWLPNPAKLDNRRGLLRWLANIGPWYFAKEAFGWLDEETKNVYLTDGGHFDNLGLYELLKRRCKVIIAIDAEADPALNFTSLIRLQRYARIDLGVLIDLPWEEIQRSNALITPENPHGPSGDPQRCHGPHVAVGRIDYSDDEHGVLFYVKASMSGDESDLVRDYRRRNKDFPHETTLDQFFSEEQFEVYRALGFDAVHDFFIGIDKAALLRASALANWPGLIDNALRHINVPSSAVALIVQRQQDALPCA
jgi:hypothetical protein